MLSIKKITNVDKYLVIVFVISIFFDLYNGYVQQVKESSTMLPTLFKGVVMIYSLCKSWTVSWIQKYIKLLIGVFLLSTIYWLVCGYEIRVGTLISDLFKLIYPYSILLYLSYRGGKASTEKVLLYILIYGIVISASILITSYAGVAVNSYGESYGYGVKGLFKAGNDTSVALIMCLCIAFYFIERFKNPIFIIFSILILYSCLIMGTTSGMAGVAISILCFIVMPFYSIEKTSSTSKMYLLLLLGVGIPIIASFVTEIINTDSFTRNKYSLEYIMDGDARGYLQEAFFKYWKTYSITDYIFGVGNTELYENVGRILYSSNGLKRVEVDQWDIFGAYGFLLGGVIFYLPLKFLFFTFKEALHDRTMISVWIFVATALFSAHGFLAGHAYTNIMAMSVLAGFIYVVQNNKKII